MDPFVVIGILAIAGTIVLFIAGAALYILVFSLTLTGGILAYATSVFLSIFGPVITFGCGVFIRILEMIEILVSFLKHALYFGSVGQFLEGYSDLKEQIEEDYLIETGQITRRSRE